MVGGRGGGLHDCLRLPRLQTTNTQQLEILVTTLLISTGLILTGLCSQICDRILYSLEIHWEQWVTLECWVKLNSNLNFLTYNHGHKSRRKICIYGAFIKSQMPNIIFVSVGVGELQSIFKRVALFYETPRNYNIIIMNRRVPRTLIQDAKLILNFLCLLALIYE